MPETYAPHPDYEFPRNLQGYGEHGLPGLKWPNNAKIAVSFVINYEEVRARQPCNRSRNRTELTRIHQGAERSVLNGDGVDETMLREFPAVQRVNERNYDA